MTTSIDVNKRVYVIVDALNLKEKMRNSNFNHLQVNFYLFLMLTIYIVCGLLFGLFVYKFYNRPNVVGLSNAKISFFLYFQADILIQVVIINTNNFNTIYIYYSYQIQMIFSQLYDFNYS